MMYPDARRFKMAFPALTSHVRFLITRLASFSVLGWWLRSQLLEFDADFLQLFFAISVQS
jgi:hypothetical protein